MEGQETGDSLETMEIKKEDTKMQGIWSSSLLDQCLSTESKELKVTYTIPHSQVTDSVKLKIPEMPSEDLKFAPKTAGLGLKRKKDVSGRMMGTATKMMSSNSASENHPPIKKAKTLSEKRKNIEMEIMKYGILAVEKMYPRQQNSKFVKNMSLMNRGSPIKMKAKPVDLDFEEVDALDILEPFSHAKYIHQPDQNSVVYIQRRKGLVPLSSICTDSTTLISSNVKLLQGRNSRMGKPSLFFKDSEGRLIALGGSRSQEPLKKFE